MYFQVIQNTQEIPYILTEQWLQKQTQNYYRLL